MLQRAGAVGPEILTKTPTSAASGPDVGRSGLLAGPARKARDTTGRPRGESQRDDHPRWTRASRRRISPRSPLRGYAHETGVRRRVHLTLPLGCPGPVTLTTAPPTRQAASGEAGPRPTTARTRSARVDRTLDRNRPRGTGPVKRRATDSDARSTSEQDGPQVKPGRGTKPARRPRPRGKEAVPDGRGGRHRTPHPGPIRGPISSTRITAATGPLLKRAPGPGSHCDGPEACSPGEVRAGAQSLDGRGRGESTIAKYGSGHSFRVGHHVQGPGTEAPAAAAR
jgi:hypothetical protein